MEKFKRVNIKRALKIFIFLIVLQHVVQSLCRTSDEIGHIQHGMATDHTEFQQVP